jgi:hypothetical protein
MGDKWMTNWKVFERRCSRPNLRYNSGCCLEWLMKTTKTLSQHSWSLGRDLNLRPPEYEAEVLTTWPWCSVSCWWSRQTCITVLDSRDEGPSTHSSIADLTIWHVIVLGCGTLKDYWSTLVQLHMPFTVTQGNMLSTSLYCTSYISLTIAINSTRLMKTITDYENRMI